MSVLLKNFFQNFLKNSPGGLLLIIKINESKILLTKDNCNKMMLRENEPIISDETTIYDTMNKHFSTLL